MAKFESREKKAKFVLLSSIATSMVLMSLFLFGALLTNVLLE
ncbi:MAG: hypothetical protein WCB90_07725 [Methanosarcina sp.]